MLQARVILSACCAMTALLVGEVQLTPIVTLPPEVTPRVCKNATTDGYVANEINVPTPTILTGHKGIATKLGINETGFTSPPLTKAATNNRQKKYNLGNTAEATAVNLSELRSEALETDNHTESKVTAPELVLRTKSSTSASTMANYTDDVTQETVSSQLLTLKGGATVGDLTVETIVSNLPHQDANQTLLASTPAGSHGDNGTETSDMGGNYKAIVSPVYHPYLEEILRHDEVNDQTTTLPLPIRIKSEGFSPPQNYLTANYPYGSLPKFTEKEMNNLRLKHWRVQQVLQGHDHTDNPKLLGQLGMGKVVLQDKLSLPEVAAFGQKRVSSPATAVMQSSLDQDEFHKSVLASEADAAFTEQEDETSTHSKLRTFYNWISSPLKRKPSKEEDERFQQAKSQQPILPFALGYRGDFLFW